MTFSKQIEKNNAKVRARREMHNPLGDYYLRDQSQRRIERMNRFFYIIAGLALVGFILGAVYGWGGLIAALISGAGK